MKSSQQKREGTLHNMVTAAALFISLTSCTTMYPTAPITHPTLVASVETETKLVDGNAAITITKERGFYVLTINPNLYPKETAKFMMILNKFVWGVYKKDQTIMLVKLHDIPNNIILIPLDAKGKRLGYRTEFVL